METLIRLFLDSGCSIPNEDPAYVLLQVDFAELENRRSLHLGTLQNNYHAPPGGPALNMTAAGTLNSFIAWLDGVIANIPNVHTLRAGSFFYRVTNPGPIPDCEEALYHTVAAAGIHYNLNLAVPWLSANYSMTRPHHNPVITSGSPVIMHSYIFAGGNISGIYTRDGLDLSFEHSIL